MEEQEIERTEEAEEKHPKKKKGGMMPIVLGFVALSIICAAFYMLSQPKKDEKETLKVKQVIAATKPQVEAVKEEAKLLEKVADVKEKPFAQIGEVDKKRDIWEELRREAEKEDYRRPEEREVGGAGSVPTKSKEEIVNQLKVSVGEESEQDRRVYRADKKEALETEKEEYKLERTSMFAYSRSYQGAVYVEKDNQGTFSGNNSTGDAGSSAGVTDEDGITPRKSVKYNNNPTFMIGVGDILDAVVTHKIVSDTKESPVVCNVSKDLLDDKGEWVLIPSGSRVIGKAGQVANMGDSRLFIYFEKIILPSGVNIYLPPQETPGMDTEGSIGVASKVDRHFMLKFGTAFLVGLLDGLGGFAQNKVTQGSGSSYFVERSSENFKEVNSEIMQQYGNVPPTITVRQGHRMKIYFPRAIEISGYEKATNRAYGRVN